jgi:hypothetical protein
MAEKVYISTRTVINAGDPVPGIKVSLYPTGGGALIIESTSNNDGLVYLGERDAATYEIHISPSVAAVVTSGTIQSIEVVGGSTNYFDVQVNTSGLPTSSDDTLCRCSGYFVTSYGQAIEDLSIHFSVYDVRTLAYYAGQDTTKAVIPTTQVVKTDSAGFTSVDLYGGETYHVFLEGYENMSRDIVVPELTSAPLPDVLFPIPGRVEYKNSGALLIPVSAPTLTLSLAGTASATLSVSTIYRSGLVQTGFVDVTTKVDDETVATASVGDDDIEITAIAVGTATLQLTRVVSGGVSVAPALLAMQGNLSITVVE